MKHTTVFVAKTPLSVTAERRYTPRRQQVGSHRVVVAALPQPIVGCAARELVDGSIVDAPAHQFALPAPAVAARALVVMQKHIVDAPGQVHPFGVRPQAFVVRTSPARVQLQLPARALIRAEGGGGAVAPEVGAQNVGALLETQDAHHARVLLTGHIVAGLQVVGPRAEVDIEVPAEEHGLACTVGPLHFVHFGADEGPHLGHLLQLHLRGNRFQVGN
jgi:hypothetical protein